jgi:hypothetical protein
VTFQFNIGKATLGCEILRFTLGRLHMKNAAEGGIQISIRHFTVRLTKTMFIEFASHIYIQKKNP